MIYGEYTFYVLAAYALPAILIGGLCAISVIRHRKLARDDALKHQAHQGHQDLSNNK